MQLLKSNIHFGFPHSSVGKESACNAEDPSSIPGLGRSPGEGIGYLPTPVLLGFHGGSAGKESACNVGDLGLIRGLGRVPWRRERLPSPVFCSGELHTDCGAAKSRTQLSDLHFHFPYRFPFCCLFMSCWGFTGILGRRGFLFSFFSGKL